MSECVRAGVSWEFPVRSKWAGRSSRIKPGLCSVALYTAPLLWPLSLALFLLFPHPFSNRLQLTVSPNTTVPASSLVPMCVCTCIPSTRCYCVHPVELYRFVVFVSWCNCLCNVGTVVPLFSVMLWQIWYKYKLIPVVWQGPMKKQLELKKKFQDFTNYFIQPLFFPIK